MGNGFQKHHMSIRFGGRGEEYVLLATVINTKENHSYTHTVSARSHTCLLLYNKVKKVKLSLLTGHGGL
jgi:hypothetical protein